MLDGFGMSAVESRHSDNLLPILAGCELSGNLTDTLLSGRCPLSASFFKSSLPIAFFVSYPLLGGTPRSHRSGPLDRMVR